MRVQQGFQAYKMASTKKGGKKNEKGEEKDINQNLKLRASLNRKSKTS